MCCVNVTETADRIGIHTIMGQRVTIKKSANDFCPNFRGQASQIDVTQVNDTRNEIFSFHIVREICLSSDRGFNCASNDKGKIYFQFLQFKIWKALIRPNTVHRRCHKQSKIGKRTKKKKIEKMLESDASLFSVRIRIHIWWFIFFNHIFVCRDTKTNSEHFPNNRVNIAWWLWLSDYTWPHISYQCEHTDASSHRRVLLCIFFFFFHSSSHVQFNECQSAAHVTWLSVDRGTHTHTLRNTNDNSMLQTQTQTEKRKKTQITSLNEASAGSLTGK